MPKQDRTRPAVADGLPSFSLLSFRGKVHELAPNFFFLSNVDGWTSRHTKVEKLQWTSTLSRGRRGRRFTLEAAIIMRCSV